MEGLQPFGTLVESGRVAGVEECIDPMRVLPDRGVDDDRLDRRTQHRGNSGVVVLGRVVRIEEAQSKRFVGHVFVSRVSASPRRRSCRTMTRAGARHGGLTRAS